jgi:bacterioferritin (cytochrome b1)
MRSKEVEEYIDYLKTRLSLFHNNYQYATEQAIEGVLAYIEELEQNSVSKDKIKEIHKNTDNKYDFTEQILKLIGE